MPTDVQIDPVTRDFVDTDDGAWVEIDDSTTAVMLQLDCREGEWWGDPRAGSQNAAIMESDLPTIEALGDSSKRSLTELVRAGMLADLSVAIDDEGGPSGRGELAIAWRDRATSRPADLAYSPLGGHP